MKAESPPHVLQLCGINPTPGERWMESLLTFSSHHSSCVDPDGDCRHLPKDPWALEAQPGLSCPLENAAL